MKVRINEPEADTSLAGEGLIKIATGKSIELCGCGGTDSEAKSLLPVKIMTNEGKTFSSVVQLSVSSDTQSNNRGVRRVMFKVELPYRSPNDDPALASSGVLFDPKRSGQNMSAHVVISVPRTCVEDLTGSRGTVSQKAALAQVRGILSLLLTITSPETGGVSQVSALDDSSSFRSVEANRFSGEPLSFEVDANKVIVTTSASNGPSIEIVSDALNGQQGLSFENLTTDPMDSRIPLYRGLLGEKPFGCETDVSLPRVIVTSFTE